MARRGAKKQGSGETAPKSPRPRLKLPKGFKRPTSIPAAHAHMLVATTAASFGQPPYICVSTGPGGPCLRFYLDPATGSYTIPPGGEVMDCAVCRGGR
jgi:hypothetical protein